MKSINLTELVFPVFLIGNEEPTINDKVSFYYSITEDIDGNRTTKYSIIDDKNIDKDTLALRRIELIKSGVKVRRLKYAIFFLGDLIKIAKQTTWFIDSLGKIFNFRKTRKVRLIFDKIKKIIPVRTGGAIIEATTIPGRYKCLYSPGPEYLFVGFLKIDMSYILYGFYKTKQKPTFRMI